ncbi:MAG: 4-(cytidine 5'-diphospho)-2-C-methyl-D-erythritol kinase [Oscillospiraceae bacterium]|nr:4-(cytidine 5'-diphospho)-2-C-methyl-D-erythritol kinase [Oscillospiraceae bacterium]
MIEGKAYAKINLTLDVTGVLENGYHTISSVMQTISLCDEISVEKNSAGKIRLFSDGGKFADGMPLDEKNTCHKAASVFLEHIGASDGVDIHITKNIPSQAGLGGGSSDAATVLRLLNRLFDANLSYEELRALGAEIGADVPFLVTGGCALCEGIGDVLTPIEKGLSDYVLVMKPHDVWVSTPEAYRLFDEKKLPYGNSSAAMVSKLLSGERVCGLLSNDLEKAVANPEISGLKKEMVRMGMHDSLMTGSGSCVYSICDYDRLAKHVGRMCREYQNIGVYEPVSSEEVTVS